MKLSTLGYIVKDGKILFLHRNKRNDDIHLDKYNGIGGKLEPGESPEEGMKREAFEEAGIVITKMDYMGLIIFPDFMGTDHWYTFVFKIMDFRGEIKKECNEGTFVWKPISEIAKLNIWEGDKVFLKWIIEDRKFFSAKFIYKLENQKYSFAGYFAKFYK